MTTSRHQRDLIFVSYSHEDKKWLKDLLTFLKPYQRKGLKVWADPYIKVGQRWEREINHALARSCVAVLLVSQDFLASDFIHENELPSLRAAADNGELTLVCVPVSSFTYAVSELDAYQWASDPQEPIADARGNKRNTALVRITDAIVEASKGCGEQQTPSTPAIPSRRAATRTAVVADATAPLASMRGVPPQRPKHVPRAAELQRIKELFLDAGRQAVGITASRDRAPVRVGVQGRGGIGKTVLAIDTAHDPDIRRAFPDGVFWITVGQQPSLEQLQSDLLYRITGKHQGVENVAQGRDLLAEALTERPAVVVLDDVWQASHARALDGLGPSGRLIVTTRDSSVVTALGAEELELDVLEPEPALQLLAQWAGVARHDLPEEAEAVSEECGRLPLSLTLAGAQRRDGKPWVDILKALKAGKLDYLNHPYGSIFSSMQLSVDALSKEHRARLLELAVFPEDIAIPEATVVRYWACRAGLADFETRALLHEFRNKGLLYLKEADGEAVVEFHDLQRDFIILSVEDLAALHQALLDAHVAAYADDPDGWRWWYLPRDEPYLWDRLALHLREADRHTELHKLLFEYQWLSAKLQARGLKWLLNDFESFPDQGAVRLVEGALRLSAHVLEKAPEQLAAQLSGRIISLEPQETRELAASISRMPPACWPAPVHAALTPPGGPLVRTLTGHENKVNAVTLTADGRRAVSASYDRTLKVWDLDSGTLLHTLTGHEHWVNAVALTADGRRAVSASYDRTLKVWDLDSGALLHTLTGHEHWVNAVALTADGRRAVSASYDRTLKVWDLDSGALLHTLNGHEASVNAVALTADGRRAVSASYDRTLKVWDLDSGTLLHTLTGHEASVNAVALTADGGRAVSASYDRTLKVWDLDSGTLLHTLTGHEASVNAVALTADGGRAVSASYDRTLKVWDLDSGTLLHTLTGHEASVNAVTLMADGRRAVSASEDRTLKLWDLNSDALVHTLTGHENRINAVALTADGRHAVSASYDRTLKLWDLDSRALLHTVTGHENRVNAVALTADGGHAVSASQDRTLKAWDLDSGALLHTLIGHENWVNAVTLTSDGRRAISASEDRTLKVWDLASGTLLHDLTGHENRVNAVALTADGRHAVSASDDRTLKVWDLVSGTLLHDLTGHENRVNAVALTADGRRVVSASDDRTLKVWDLHSGALLHSLTGHKDWVNAVALTADGRRVVSASYDRTLKVWDLASGTLLHDLTGHENRVNAVALTADGRRAVSASDDRTLKVWDLDSGTLVHDLTDHRDWVKAVALTADGRRAVSASQDRTLKVWELETLQLITESFADAALICVAVREAADILVAGDALGGVHILRLEGCDASVPRQPKFE